VFKGSVAGGGPKDEMDTEVIGAQRGCCSIAERPCLGICKRSAIDQIVSDEEAGMTKLLFVGATIGRRCHLIDVLHSVLAKKERCQTSLEVQERTSIY